MTGRHPEPREGLDALLGDLPLGPAPVAELLTRGRTRRRRRAALATGAAAVLVGASVATAALVVQRDGSTGGKAPIAVDPSSDAAPAPPEPISLDLRASTDPSSQPLAGHIVTRVKITATVKGSPGAVVGRETLPWRHEVPGLAPGSYDVVGEVFDDGRPVRSCHRTLSLLDDTTLDVVFRSGAPCTITTAGS